LNSAVLVHQKRFKEHLILDAISFKKTGNSLRGDIDDWERANLDCVE
jgi:hypothetical protein